MYILKTIPFMAFMALVSVSVQADQKLSIKNRMPQETFDAAGLHKLSAKELEVLTHWLGQQHGDQTTPEPESSRLVNNGAVPTRESAAKPDHPNVAFGQEQIEQTPATTAPESIASRIQGEFRGWSGDTVFRLENGQIWRQRVGGKYRSAMRTNPDVVVERGRFGYYLKMVESGRSVGVKRIQ